MGREDGRISRFANVAFLFAFSRSIVLSVAIRYLCANNRGVPYPYKKVKSFTFLLRWNSFETRKQTF